MTLEDIKDNFIGEWTGENVLHLSWLTPPQFHSPSVLTAANTVSDKFLSFNYKWEHENTPHEGLLLLGYDAEKKIVNAVWVDSWHSSAKPLALAGTIDDTGTVDLRGAYEVPNHPDWGWRIVINRPDDRLQLTMYNLSPEDEEDLAVQADYRRLAK